jgi:hypothetical protein
MGVVIAIIPEAKRKNEFLFLKADSDCSRAGIALIDNLLKLELITLALLLLGFSSPFHPLRK